MLATSPFLDMEEKLQQGHNIVLISNHQTEADPAVIALLLESTNPLIAENMIYVAGDRVVTDPLCKPFSMGRNLLCVYSKKHMNDVPELAEMKRRANTRSLKEMALLLREAEVSPLGLDSEASLRCLLEGVEACCREVDNQRWVFDWMEGNRKHRMERPLNKAGSGWNSLAERLRGLGVAPSGSFKVTSGPEILLKLKGGSKVLWREKGVEVKSFADAVKSTREGVVVSGKGLLLFDFELPFKAERVLTRGKRSIKENFIILDRWNPEVGCLCKNSNADEAWVRVVGLPLHLWSLEVFKRIGDGCGVVVGISTLVHAGGAGGKFLRGGSPRVGEEISGTSCTACYGSQREKVEQLRESSFNRLDVFGLGSKGLYCGPIGLDLGEAQGPFNEIQVDLGRVSKPNDLNGFKRYNKGMMDVGCGPVEADAKGEGAFFGGRGSISLSRAQSEPSITKKEAQVETTTLLSGCR
ncbi:Glycerol-3-phosphate acyltransferase, chloroplastic [Vitis vinifera]|uniref:Glycerol-3-phosphate acyltransferase, chloroplastic n=1 Tax=Vitis vinifera TaxID=29760 RepID=A0A438GC51_VITVI|nr:Glycerol-3-phosphate acyltransferase, chloroplastic [Vitis vinifera]